MRPSMVPGFRVSTGRNNEAALPQHKGQETGFLVQALECARSKHHNESNGLSARFLCERLTLTSAAASVRALSARLASNSDRPTAMMSEMEVIFGLHTFDGSVPKIELRQINVRHSNPWVGHQHSRDPRYLFHFWHLQRGFRYWRFSELQKTTHNNSRLACVLVLELVRFLSSTCSYPPKGIGLYDLQTHGAARHYRPRKTQVFASPFRWQSQPANPCRGQINCISPNRPFRAFRPASRSLVNSGILSPCSSATDWGSLPSRSMARTMFACSGGSVDKSKSRQSQISASSSSSPVGSGLLGDFTCTIRR